MKMNLHTFLVSHQIHLCLDKYHILQHGLYTANSQRHQVLHSCHHLLIHKGCQLLLWNFVVLDDTYIYLDKHTDQDTDRKQDLVTGMVQNVILHARTWIDHDNSKDPASHQLFCSRKIVPEIVQIWEHILSVQVHILKLSGTVWMMLYHLHIPYI